jgi:hypothetical protein
MLSSASPAPSPRAGGTRYRQTQRLAADRLIDALKRTTALLPADGGATTGGATAVQRMTIDEVLAMGASAIYGLSDENQAQQREQSRLRVELAAAYRASAIAAADEVSSARREVDEAEARSEVERRAAAARAEELEAAVRRTHEELAESQRANRALQRALERSAAGATLLEQRLGAAREAARQVMNALPPSAVEEAAEAERLARLACGEAVPTDDVDEMTLLARALDRALRSSERLQAGMAEAALYKTELEAERAEGVRRREELEGLQQQHQASLEERASARRDVADAQAAREAAEEAARRFHALLEAQTRSFLASEQEQIREAREQQLRGHREEEIQRMQREIEQRGMGAGAPGEGMGVAPPPLEPPLRDVESSSMQKPLYHEPAVDALVRAVAGQQQQQQQQGLEQQQRGTPPRAPPARADTTREEATGEGTAAAAVASLEAAVREATAMTALLAQPTSVSTTSSHAAGGAAPATPWTMEHPMRRFGPHGM